MSGASQPTPGVSLPFGATVTIFFSDIRGFTEYTEQYGDEAAFRILRQHNALVRKQIEAFGGRVVKTQGDSFMVYFTTARAAILCAIGVQRAVAEQTRGQQDARIAIGIGINTGEPIQEGGDFFGSTVNLAARICASAGPGQILISETTRYVAGRIEAVDYVDRGLRELKGFQEPQRLFEVHWGASEAREATGGQVSRELRAELGALAERFSRLGAEMLDTSRAMAEAGPPPSDELARQATALSAAFAEFRGRLVQRAAGLGLEAGPPGSIATLVDAEPILAAIQEAESKTVEVAPPAEEERRAIEAAVQRALSVLTRVLLISHRDDPVFHPLLECQGKASDLRLRLSRAIAGDSEYTAQRVDEVITPFADLLTFVVGRDTLDDEKFTRIEDGVTRAFGRQLALAATRGRLWIEGLASPARPGAGLGAAATTSAGAPPPREERREAPRADRAADVPAAAVSLPPADPRGAAVVWWAAASDAWRAWKASGMATAHAVRAAMSTHGYLLAVPVRRSAEYDEGRLAANYFLLLEHVENVSPAFIRTALDRAVEAAGGATDAATLEPALYELMVTRGRLRDTYPEFVRDIMIAAIPIPGVWLDAMITEHDDATVIARAASVGLGGGGAEEERLTEAKDRAAEHRFVVTAAPLTARFIAVRRGDLRESRDIEVQVTVDGEPSDAAWILHLRSDQMLHAPPKRHTQPVSALPGLGKQFAAVWVSVFNSDPLRDRQFEISLAVRAEIKMTAAGRRPSVFGTGRPR